MDNPNRFSAAKEDFRLARRRATVQKFLSRFSGRSQRLISFDEVRKLVGADSMLSRGLHEIELDSIVGSVDRYEDFTRSFLPRQESQADRWAKIRVLAETEGFPPIEVYQVGKVYFVLDGHHRVSVARQLGQNSIQAYVTEVAAKSTFDPEDDADDLILKAEEIRFMKDTKLDKSRPDMRLELTSADGYRILREHIAVHQYYMGLEQKREISIEEAAAHWIAKVYIEAIAAIRRNELLRDFPGRTEADLYLWLMDHRTGVAEGLGWELESEEAAKDLRDRFSLRMSRILSRLKRWLVDIATPDTLERGPRIGEWRDGRDTAESHRSLFRRILVAVSGEPRSWRSLEQAGRVAKREKGQLRGLHVPFADAEPDEINRIQGIFQERVEAAGINGRLVVEEGEARRVVEARSYWSDLVVLHLAHPPADNPLSRFSSGIRELIQRIPRPLLLVPRYTDMQHALLAFDGSRKATEALYLAAYLQLKWGIKLTVFTGYQKDGKDQRARKRQNFAQDYLEEKGVSAEYFIRAGKIAESIISLAEERECDFLLMGGYGDSPMMQLLFGSTLDSVLRDFNGPTLICR